MNFAAFGCALAAFAFRCVSLSLLIALSSHAATATTTAHVLRYADGQDVHTLDPFLDEGDNVIALSELTMAHFTRLDDHGNHIPDLITALPSVANGGLRDNATTIVWHLRRNVRWSDGRPFTANDVVYTVRVAQDPKNNLAERAPWTHIESVTAPDDTTVVFHLTQPDPGFLDDYFSARSTSCILPEHLLGPSTAIDDAAYNALPVGTGPFRYTAFHRGDRVDLEANPYFWRGTPRLARIEYRLTNNVNTTLLELQSGEIDLWRIVSVGVIAQVEAIPAIVIQRYQTAGVAVLRGGSG